MISAMDLLYYLQRYPISITENYDNVHPVNNFLKSMLKELDPLVNDDGDTKSSGVHFDSENEDEDNVEVEDDEYSKSLSNSYLQRKFDIDYQIYVERKQLREDELSTLYGILIGLVPTDSKDRLRSHEDYSKVKSTRNGFQLWIIIWETSQVSSSYLSPTQQMVEMSTKFYILYFQKIIDPLSVLLQLEGCLTWVEISVAHTGTYNAHLLRSFNLTAIEGKVALMKFLRFVVTIDGPNQSFHLIPGSHRQTPMVIMSHGFVRVYSKNMVDANHLNKWK
jgi:hypothetical protein